MLTLTMIALAAQMYDAPEWQAFFRWRDFYERDVGGGMGTTVARYDPASVRHGVRYVRVRYGARNPGFGFLEVLGIYWMQIDCPGRRARLVSGGDLRRQTPQTDAFEPFAPGSLAGNLAARVCPRG